MKAASTLGANRTRPCVIWAPGYLGSTRSVEVLTSTSTIVLETVSASLAQGCHGMIPFATPATLLLWSERVSQLTRTSLSPASLRFGSPNSPVQLAGPAGNGPNLCMLLYSADSSHWIYQPHTPFLSCSATFYVSGGSSRDQQTTIHSIHCPYPRPEPSFRLRKCCNKSSKTMA